MYKILSLDGGGSWAILQLLTLKERYKDELPELKGHFILQKFDMVIANSGGSIVLAALCANWTIDEALTLFDEKETRESIFSKNTFKETFWPVFITKWFSLGPKYSSKRKYEAFRKEVFPELHKIPMNLLPAHIGKNSLKLVVSTFDALNNRAKFFKSYSSDDDAHEYVPITKAIHGSSNAPVQYFDFPAKIKADSNIWYYLWDGALGGFNNPIVAGIIEAFKLGVDMSKVAVISLGNGNKLMSKSQKETFYKHQSITIKERSKKWKVWRYKYQFRYFMDTVMNQAKTILFEPPDWANYVALIIMSMSKKENLENRLIRLSPIIHIGESDEDNTITLLNKLYSLDMDLTCDDDIKIIKNCFDYWKAGKIKNQPIEFNVTRDNVLEYKTGDKYFEEGLNKWKSL